MENSKNKPIKCWYCAKLGKCQVLKPCKDFVKYNYSTGRKVKKKKIEYKIYTQNEVAEILNISRKSVCAQIKIEPKLVLSRLNKITGEDFKYEKLAGKKKFFIVKEE